MISPKFEISPIASNFILSIDNNLLNYVQSLTGNNSLDNFMVILTLYGRELVWPSLIFLLFVIGGDSGRKTALVISISFIILLPLTTIIKDIIGRDRPDFSTFLLPPDNEYSFPSGHATIVMAGAVSMLILFKGRKKTVISVVFFVEAILVSISRVYLAHHFPLDIIGGALLGSIVSLIVIGYSNALEKIFLKNYIMQKLFKTKN